MTGLLTTTTLPVVTITDPTGPDDGTKRALRGEGYSTNADRLRSAYRGRQA